MRRLRAYLVALAAGGLALAAGGCGGTTGPGAGEGSAASIVPASALAYLALDTDLQSGQWQAVDRLAGAFPDKSLALDRLRAELRKKDLDWKQDVQPALGREVDVAALDLSPATDVVGLVRPADGDAFARLVEKVNADAKTPADKVYTREVGGWQVVADAPAKLDRFEELRKDPARLADDESFKAALAAGSRDALVWAYVNGPRALAALRRFEGAQAAQLERLGTLDWLLVTGRAEERGLRVEGIVHGTPGQALATGGAHPFTPHLPAHVPAGVVAYYAFHGSGAAVQQLGTGTLFSPAQLGTLAAAIKQIAPLLRGENAIYVRAAEPFPEVTLVTEPGSGVRPTRVLDRLLARFGSFLPARPRPVRIAGRPGRVLSLGSVRLYYVTVDGRLLVSDSRAGIADFAGGGPKLASDRTFRSALAAAGVGDRTLGYLYLNGRRTLGLVERYAGALPPMVRRNLEPLRSLVLDVRTKPREARATIFAEIRR